MIRIAWRSGDRSERGAALVEMAVVLPLFILLVFGTIEASWAFAQANDVRHGVREGARLAAVDFGTAAEIRSEICSRMDLKTDPARVTVEFLALNGTGERGDTATLRVVQQYDSLTGLLDPIFQDRPISSEIEFRLERPTTGLGPAQWWSATGAIPCG